jgi:Trehalase
MSGDWQSLLASCKLVLEENKRGDFTIPAADLYPHQWLWDSCFIAIGLANYDVDRAKKEILSLLRGQWSNGMIPNMLFADGDDHRRDREFWRSWLNPQAPDDVATSGITQPPMLAEAIVRIGQKLPKDDRRSWYQSVWPQLLAYHKWLYAERDPHKEGLVLQVHPWETGLDSTPPWIWELHEHQMPVWIRLVDKLKLVRLIDYFRRDTHYIPPGQRLSTVDILAYYSIQRRLKRKSYDIDQILNHSMLTIEDLTFNCIFIRANEHLKTIAKTIGHELPEELKDSIHKSREALDTLWDAYAGQYFSRNFITHKLIKQPSIATLMPLYTGCISDDRAKALVRLLQDKRKFATSHPVPTVPLDSEWYKELSYWQGPVWLNTNWLIINGLKQYGFDELASELSKKSVNLVEKSGPFEYFSAKNGRGTGAKNFSWTAALAIDLIEPK